MKKTMRKVISMLLLVVLVVTMLPESIFGKETGMAAKVKAGTKIASTVDEEQNEVTDAMGDRTPRWTVGEDAVMAVNDELEYTASAKAAALPDSVDNSQTSYFPEIGDQGNVGSCVCWAEVYYNFTYTLCKARNVAARGKNVMSPIFIYNKIRKNAETLDKSGSSFLDATRLLKSIGTPSYDLATGDQDNTYLTWFATEEIWKNAAQNRLSSYTEISNPLGQITSPKDKKLDTLKRYLADGKLISYSTDMKWKYKTIPSGSPYAEESICTEAKVSTSGRHRMIIVGYNDDIYVDINGDGTIQEAEKGAFKIANSWGTDYKNKGFCWVSYDALNKTSAVLPEDSRRDEVFYSMAIMNVEKEKKASGVSLKTTLNTKNRDQINMTICAEDADGKKSNYIVEPFESNNWGQVSLDGKETATDGTILIGLDNVISDITASKMKDYMWTVTVEDQKKDGNTVRIKELSFVNSSGSNLYAANVNNCTVDGDTYTWSLGENVVKLTPSIPSGKATESQNVTFTAKAAKPENLEYQFLVDGVIKRDFSSDSSFTWKSEYRNGGHKIEVKAKNVKSGKIVTEKEIDYEVADALGVTVTPSIPSGKVTETQNVTFTVTANNTKNLQYQFLINRTVMQEYSTSPSFVWKSEYRPTKNVVQVNVKNTVTGKVITKQLSYMVNKVPYFTGVTIGTASPRVGDTLTVIMSSIYGTGTLTKRFEVQPEGGEKTKIFEGPITSESTWIPTQEGKHTLYFTIIDENNFSASYTMNCVVGSAANRTNIYYANSNYSNAYIHYRIGNGAWTTVPGVKMYTSSEQAGYTWKYTIDLEDESEATVCFNNGSDLWDSKNGANYTVYAGNYGVKNQQVTKLNDIEKVFRVKGFNVSHKAPISIVDARSVKLSASAENGSGDYSYRFGSILNGKEYYMTDGYKSSDNVTVDFWTFMSSTNQTTADAVGTHTLFVDVKDNQDGRTARATISDYKVEGLEITDFSAGVASPQLVGTPIELSAVVKNEAKYQYNTYDFYVIKNGVKTKLNKWYTSNKYSISWTPTEAGDYTLEYYICDNIGQEATATLNYKIVDTMNQATVYYANSEWSDAYIHYRTGNGTWTTAPGVKMESSSEQSGYKWKFVIDLGSESTATVCFNNGNGSWDSKNGANYTVYAGSYGIKNQQVNELKDSNASDSTAAVNMAVLSNMQKVFRVLQQVNNNQEA